MKVLFTGVILDPSWTGGEPIIARTLASILSAQGVKISKAFIPRERPRKWNIVKPWTALTIADPKIVNVYRHYIEKTRPDIIMTWYDFDLSAFLASTLSAIPTIAQAQNLWPVCPLSSLFSEITEAPCSGPNRSCGFCLVKRAKVYREIPPVVPSIACLPSTLLSMMKTNNLRSKLSHASAIVSDSQFLKTMMARINYDTRNVHVIYNGVDLNTIKPPVSNNSLKIVLFLSNNINRQKGVYHFVQLSKNLKPEFPEVKFLWVGQTELIGDTFETLGYVWDEQKLQEIYDSSYLLLLPSLWPEPMSFSVIQAMAHGKPIVAYDIGANSEAINHGKTGFLAKWGDIDQLTSHVRTLLLDQRLASQMGQNARRRAEEMFSIERMTSDYMNLLKKTQHAPRD